MTLAEFNALPKEPAQAELLRCCGCARWVAAVAAARPFADKAALLAASDAAWAATAERDWLEAFSHHPRIGGKDALRAKFAATQSWATGEQAGAAAASEAVLDELAAGNAAYENRFGHIFIVCATGKSAAEMLDLLKSRLGNEPGAELRLAAGEQNKITKIRLEKLLS
ncbi:MAG: 2-oxo-4-hydroxy-4-carboxy-5-ureidoimidazoline decarboxylase [Elusimicrobiota bacterium]|nr:2-oxo-4-hydroxy-4-carboxy-5-ureidoimidazoline decarboxylase [Elusimicrobiota bacterium]